MITRHERGNRTGKFPAARLARDVPRRDLAW